MKVKPLKAERVQFWQRVVDATRSLASRIYDFFRWLEVTAGALKRVAASFITLRKS